MLQTNQIEYLEAANNCETLSLETLSLAKTASEGLDYSEEDLRLLTEKWSRYILCIYYLASCF